MFNENIVDELRTEFTVLFRKREQARSTREIYSLVDIPQDVCLSLASMAAEEKLRRINEWWRTNTEAFVKELKLLFTIVTADNEAWKNRYIDFLLTGTNGFPMAITYMWKHSRKSPPEELPVDVYVEEIFAWCEHVLGDVRTFPRESNQPLADIFIDRIEKVFSRLARVFYIILANDCLASRLQENISFKLCMKHFFYFGWKWEILPLARDEEMGSTIRRYRNEFLADRKAFFASF